MTSAQSIYCCTCENRPKWEYGKEGNDSLHIVIICTLLWDLIKRCVIKFKVKFLFVTSPALFATPSDRVQVIGT